MGQNYIVYEENKEKGYCLAQLCLDGPLFIHLILTENWGSVEEMWESDGRCEETPVRVICPWSWDYISSRDGLTAVKLHGLAKKGMVHFVCSKWLGLWV